VVTLILKKVPNAISREDHYAAIKQAVSRQRTSLTKALCLQGNINYFFTEAARQNEIKVIEKILKYAKERIDGDTLNEVLIEAVNKSNGPRTLAILEGAWNMVTIDSTTHITRNINRFLGKPQKDIKKKLGLQ
ncbi:MAG: hypothetical protein AAFQ01_00870, partial [Bacteroidota bacterium]